MNKCKVFKWFLSDSKLSMIRQRVSKLALIVWWLVCEMFCYIPPMNEFSGDFLSWLMPLLIILTKKHLVFRYDKIAFINGPEKVGREWISNVQT